MANSSDFGGDFKRISHIVKNARVILAIPVRFTTILVAILKEFACFEIRFGEFQGYMNDLRRY